MIIGILEIKLYIPESNSLKHKRRIIKSILDRVKNHFNVSIAEIGHQDISKTALVGLTVVGNDSSHINSILDKIVSFINRLMFGAMADYKREIISYGD
jgi:hypothetical protein